MAELTEGWYLECALEALTELESCRRRERHPFLFLFPGERRYWRERQAYWEQSARDWLEFACRARELRTLRVLLLLRDPEEQRLARLDGRDTLG